MSSVNLLLLEDGDIILLETGGLLGQEDLVADVTATAPTASATASAPVPSSSIVVDVPVASATASLPAPVSHGTTPGVDLPTSLEMERITGLALAERTTDLALERVTGIAFPYFALSPVQGRSTGISTSYRTSLEITMETTLELHDRELELALDG